MGANSRATFATAFLLTAVLFSASAAPAAEAVGQPASILPNLNQLTGSERAAGWKLLFDGKTTAGWRNFKKPGISQGWQVIDGELCRVAKSAGDIITTEQYGNFELELDYKVPPHANSPGWAYALYQPPLDSKYCEYEIGSEDFNRRVAGSKFASWPKFAKYAVGHIALQGDHGDICLANIKLRPLPAKR